MKKKNKKNSSKSAKNDPSAYNWSFFFLRVSFGFFMFFMGLPKLQMVISGNNPLWSAFGIPMWLAWIVALIEVIGGVFIVLGLFQKCSASTITILLFVAMLLTTIVPFDVQRFFLHLVYIGVGLVIAFSKNKFVALDYYCNK